MRNPRVFVDSSVLITALLSPRGGSFHILDTLRERVKFSINEYVYREVLLVIVKKFSHVPGMESRFFLMLGWANISVLPYPSVNQIGNLRNIIVKDDTPILAGAIAQAHSDYLLTLDNDFFAPTVITYAKKYNLCILKPKELIAIFKLSASD